MPRIIVFESNLEIKVLLNIVYATPPNLNAEKSKNCLKNMQIPLKFHTSKIPCFKVSYWDILPRTVHF